MWHFLTRKPWLSLYILVYPSSSNKKNYMKTLVMCLIWKKRYKWFRYYFVHPWKYHVSITYLSSYIYALQHLLLNIHRNEQQWHPTNLLGSIVPSTTILASLPKRGLSCILFVSTAALGVASRTHSDVPQHLLCPLSLCFPNFGLRFVMRYLLF